MYAKIIIFFSALTYEVTNKRVQRPEFMNQQGRSAKKLALPYQIYVRKKKRLDSRE